MALLISVLLSMVEIYGSMLFTMPIHSAKVYPVPSALMVPDGFLSAPCNDMSTFCLLIACARHGCSGNFPHHRLPFAIIQLISFASHHMWMYGLLTLNCTEFCQNYPGYTVGGFAMAHMPMITFWQPSNMNELYLQPSMAISVGFLQTS